jgi:hypothetical protein
MRLQPAMLEVHRIIDSQRVEVVNLLDPERGSFVIADTGFARQVVRFEVYAGHSFTLPHYTRLLGTCVLIDDTNWMVRELGLTEILFEPPPPRPRQPPSHDVTDEDEEDLPPYSTLPAPPGLAGSALDQAGSDRGDGSRAHYFLTHIGRGGLLQ